MATGTRESVSVGAPGLPCTGACSFPEPPPTKEHEPPVLTSATLNLRRASHVLLLGAARFEEGNLPYGTEVREGESNEFRVEVREHGAKQPTLEWGTVVLEKANQYRYPPPVSFDRVVDEAAGRHTFALTAQGRVTPGRKAEARNVSLAAIACAFLRVLEPHAPLAAPSTVPPPAAGRALRREREPYRRVNAGVNRPHTIRHHRRKL